MGLTQADIAERVGASPRTVQNWEGTAGLLPKWPHLVKLARLLGCSVADLYERRSEDREPNGDFPAAA